MRLGQAVALTYFLPHWESGVILPLFGFYRDARPGIGFKKSFQSNRPITFCARKAEEKRVWTYLAE